MAVYANDLPNGNIKDMRGKRFGRLTVLEYAGSRGSGQYAHWHCICDCGQEAAIKGQSLRAGDTRSCGCLNQEMRHSAKVHGMHNIPEYHIWQAAKARCNNSNNAKFEHYGGRGIKMCREWQDNFAVFIADVGRRPEGKYTLERIDNDGNYEPSNCQWATYATQNRNNRRTRLLTFRGETHCLTDWAKIVGLNRDALNARIRSGWSIKKALTTPLRRNYA